MKVPTESLARACARKPWTTILAWLGLVLIAGFLTGQFLGDALSTEFKFLNNPESKRADKLLEEEIRGPLKANDIVIVRSTSLTVDDPAFRSEVEAIHSKVRALGTGIIERSTNFYESGDASLVSANKHTTLIPMVMAGSLNDASKNIKEVLAVTEADQNNQFEVIVTGSATIGSDFEETSTKDLLRGEVFGVPIALVILVIAFGAIMAAFIPVILAAVSIMVAMGATALIGIAFDLSFFVVNPITMIGLAVGIDYSLFIVSRFREERSRGLEKYEAIARAGATATRTVLFSGITVMVALMGMLIIPDNIFKSVAIGAILVAIAAVLANLTLLPAILGLMGDRVNSLRVPFIQRQQAKVNEEGSGGFWDRVARMVMARPGICLLISVGILITAAIPLLDINPGFNGISTLPDNLESKKGFEVLESEFSFGLVTPAEIVVKGETNSPSVKAAIQRLRTTLEATPGFKGPSTLQTNASGTVALVSIQVVGDPDKPASVERIRDLRKSIIPQTFSGTNAEVLVTGQTARDSDYFALTSKYWPYVFAFVLGLSFLLLMLIFRSLVVPAKAIIMNLLSVGAAYGMIVLVFQKGVGADFFGFTQGEAIEAWLPLFLFCVLFGMSMDYHVFLLSRIRERYDSTKNNTEAVAFGIRSTGRLITGAALIMVAVFSAFATGELAPLQQMGFGLAVAVLLDATVVRIILVPSSMKLLGNANWYLPKALSWLPDLRIEPEKTPQQADKSTSGRLR